MYIYVNTRSVRNERRHGSKKGGRRIYRSVDRYDIRGKKERKKKKLDEQLINSIRREKRVHAFIFFVFVSRVRRETYYKKMGRVRNKGRKEEAGEGGVVG